MIKRCAGLVLFLLGAAGLQAHAAGDSCLVIETGLRMEGPESRTSLLWENGLLETLFEAGHIATNAPILRLEKTPERGVPEEAAFYLEDALASGMDYLIIVLLNYQVEGGKTALTKVTLSLFSTNPEKLIVAQQFLNIGAASGSEAGRAVQRAAQSIISHIEG